jgi:hypothetical protein
MEATPGIEPGYADLQCDAAPLCHLALGLRPPRCSAATGNEPSVPSAGAKIMRTTPGLVFGGLGMAA